MTTGRNGWIQTPPHKVACCHWRVLYSYFSLHHEQCLAGRAPEYLIELCHSVTDIPARRNLRSSSQVQLLVPRYRKERSGKRGFSVSSPQLWNLLPADIRLLHNENQLFRKRLWVSSGKVDSHYMQQSMWCHWGSMSTVWTLLLLLRSLHLCCIGYFTLSGCFDIVDVVASYNMFYGSEGGYSQ